MKTFEESISLSIRPYDSEAESERVTVDMSDMMTRYADLLNEAAASERFELLMEAWEEMDQRDAHSTAFMVGLVTGIEMEKGSLAPSGDVVASRVSRGRTWLAVIGRYVSAMVRVLVKPRADVD
jgi:hypothetical protein